MSKTLPKANPSKLFSWAEIMAFVTMLLSWFHAASPPANVVAAFTAHGIDGKAIPSWLWAIVMGLISKTPALLALVEADIAAGKTFGEILSDVIAAILGPNPPIPVPTP